MNSKEFKRLNAKCMEEWERKVGTKDIVLAAKDVFTNPTKLYSHSNPLESVKSKYDRDVSSRRGNYAEKVVFMVIKNDPRFKFLRECSNDEESHSKLKLHISIPASVNTLIESIIAKASSEEKFITLKDKDELRKVINLIYQKAYDALDVPESEMIHYKQDLDIGFEDIETGNVYLYEVKYTGSFGGDVAWEHLRKYLRAFADYVYKNKPARDKIHTAMLLVKRDNPDSFRYLARGENGFITFEDFCDTHNIDLTKDQINKLFLDITQIDDNEVANILDMFSTLIQEDKDILSRNTSDFLKKFANEFSIDL
jgi:hypothetical protein